MCFALCLTIEVSLSLGAADQSLGKNWQEVMKVTLEWQAQGHYRDAERVLMVSIHDAEKCVDADPAWLPTALVHLGGLYRSMGQLGLAETTYVRAERLWSERFGESSLGLSLALSDRAWVHLAEGEPRKAESLWTRSLQVRIAILGPNDPSVARIYGYMAVGAFADRRLENAERLCHEALAIYRQTGDIANETDVVLGSLASIRFEQADAEEAQRLARKAAEIQRSSATPSPRLLAGYLYTLARAEAKCGQRQGAAEHFQQADELLQKAPLRETPLRHRILESYRSFLRSTGQREQARTVSTELQAVDKKLGMRQAGDSVVDMSDLMGTR
jgi:tetratricopeptide (TPR) repeat protein